MKYQIIRYPVFPTLPEEDSRRMDVDISNVVNMIVIDEVLPVHIFGSRAVSAKHDACTAHLFYMVAGNGVFHPVQIHPNGATTTVGKMALFNVTVLQDRPSRL